MKSWCPIIPKDLPEEVIKDAYSGLANNACQQGWNTLENLGGEQILADSSWNDFINLNGQAVYFHPYGYNIERAEKLFGEDLLAEYEEPFKIKMYLEINDKASILGALGGQFADLDGGITGYVHIKTFDKLAVKSPYYLRENMLREPKVHDVIQLISYGCDRPGDRSSQYYRISAKDDHLVSAKINPFFGHYVWRLSLKRHINSYEGGSIDLYGEDETDQIYGEDTEGIINNPAVPPKPKKYDFDVNRESKEHVYDQSKEGLDKYYGGYYE